MLGESLTTVLLALAGTIGVLAGLIVWAVKFFAQKLFGKDGENGAIGRLVGSLGTLRDEMHGMRGDLQENTAAVRQVYGLQQQSHNVLAKIAERSKHIGEQTMLSMKPVQEKKKEEKKSS